LRLDFPALRAVERAVMQRDCKRIVVDAPEFAENSSACQRVLTKSSVVLCALIAAKLPGSA
jgi:hypothetical protein